MLRESMDCSGLRKLDFGIDNPTDFFTCFAGLCPNLKTSSFGVVEGTATAVGPAKVFVESLDALEHLDVSRAQQIIDDLWHAIEKHKDTLKILVLGSTLGDWHDPKYVGLSRLEAIASTFSRLERLGWNAPCETNVSPNH
jgi:hypothetical protein